MNYEISDRWEAFIFLYKIEVADAMKKIPDRLEKYIMRNAYYEWKNYSWVMSEYE